MTTSRDDRHRRAAQRLRALTVDLGAEVVARGGSLDYFEEMTTKERVEAEAQAPNVFRDRVVAVATATRDAVQRARRIDRSTSTD